MDYRIRDLTVADEPILWTMLMYAAHEPSLESVQRQPILIPIHESVATLL
ncbi:hypothetical protein [Phormidium tenue]|uniref:GNAT family N-acetyltransferase n=1 Tax=Phormidium tenue FACHB-1050 TaxID=2692857 RepID=A0ABR8CAD2_9CYAN|nr:hypothetical protein [Phormidium tenue]MBD2317494.1 hypothetical protein [Phormidium tenue FACHB-1050]